MSSQRALPIALGVSLLAMAWASLTVSERLSAHVELAVFVVATFMVSVDVADFVVRLYLRRTTGGSVGRTLSPTSIPLDDRGLTAAGRRVRLKPYALVASLYNAEDDVDAFVTAMAPYRDRFWLIDDGSSDRTGQKLRQAGWRCVDGECNRRKPAAIKHLLQSLPPSIETVIVVDPDFRIRADRIDGLSSLEAVIFDFQQSGRAALCPCIVTRGDGLLARFQAFEYAMAFSLGRRSLAGHSITSGASVYRRDALAYLLGRHSLSVYGEDLENSVILLGDGEDIYYDARLVLETEGKRRWADWFSQRVGWSYGLIAVYARHARRVWRIAQRSPGAAYHYLAYSALLVLALHPFRTVSALLLSLAFLGGVGEVLGASWSAGVAEPAYFVSAFLSYHALALVALVVAVPPSERLGLLPIVPLYVFYALALVAPVTVGYLNWFAVRWLGRRVWRDHYQDDGSLRQDVEHERAQRARDHRSETRPLERRT